MSSRRIPATNRYVTRIRCKIGKRLQIQIYWRYSLAESLLLDFHITGLDFTVTLWVSITKIKMTPKDPGDKSSVMLRLSRSTPRHQHLKVITTPKSLGYLLFLLRWYSEQTLNRVSHDSLMFFFQLVYRLKCVNELYTIFCKYIFAVLVFHRLIVD